MPFSPEWNYKEFNWFTGFLGTGQPRYEVFDFWWKDLLGAICELVENPDLKDDMCYTPMKLYVDKEKTQRIYNNMQTCDWWNEKAVRTSHLICLI